MLDSGAAGAIDVSWEIVDLLVAIELVFALFTYTLITTSGVKKPSSVVVFLAIVLAVLGMAGLALGSIWALLIGLPILAGLGVLIGSLLGVSVNSLSSKTARPVSKLIIWFFGLALLILVSFHSKYRPAYDALMACDSDVQPPQEVLAVFKGLENQRFNLVLDPVFAWITVNVDHKSSFFWGSSKYRRSLSGHQLRSASCDLTRKYTRPMPIITYKHTIRLSKKTSELLGANVDQLFSLYTSVVLDFRANELRPIRWQKKFEQELVMPSGQTLRIKNNVRQRRNWHFSSDYHGLVVTFDLEGSADKPPIEQATRIVEIFNSMGYLVPAKSVP